MQIKSATKHPGSSHSTPRCGRFSRACRTKSPSEMFFDSQKRFSTQKNVPRQLREARKEFQSLNKRPRSWKISTASKDERPSAAKIARCAVDGKALPRTPACTTLTPRRTIPTMNRPGRRLFKLAVAGSFLSAVQLKMAAARAAGLPHPVMIRRCSATSVVHAWPARVTRTQRKPLCGTDHWPSRRLRSSAAARRTGNACGTAGSGFDAPAGHFRNQGRRGSDHTAKIRAASPRIGSNRNRNDPGLRNFAETARGVADSLSRGSGFEGNGLAGSGCVANAD